MDSFNIGDKIVYNPNIPDLKPPKHRPNDWGIIIDKNNHYLIILLYKNLHIMSVIPNCITHFDPNQAEPNIKIIDKIIPYKTFDAITFIEFVENDIIVDFLRTTTQYESEFNMYYNENTFNQLCKNPMSNLAIDYTLIKKFRVKFNIK
jgi:hypothetical protein